MKKCLLTLSLLIVAIVAMAADAVKWDLKLVDDNTDHPSVEITATVSPGYHLYAVENPAGGSNPLEFFFDVKGCKLDGKVKANKAYTKEFDDVFEVDQYFYTGTVKFTQKLKPTAKSFTVNVELKGQACDDKGCVPLFASKKFTGTSPVGSDVAEEATEEETPGEALAEMTDSLHQASGALTPGAMSGGVSDPNWWNNVEAELDVFENNPSEQERSLLYIFIAGFLGGLIALVTPCVWPMIPMTVSFFLKQNKSRSKSVATAAVYGGSIIVIYVVLGLAVTAIFGASALNELATSRRKKMILKRALVAASSEDSSLLFPPPGPIRWTPR